jgi:outer membrane protein TolC
MISHINDLRNAGKNLWDAVVTGARHRFRPILMTATVAVLGLLPASLATGIGSDVQRPLATVIVYGLLAGTAITLFLLPTLYYLIEKRELKKEERKMRPRGVLLSIGFLVCLFGSTQTANAQRILTYDEYMKNVREKNVEYLVEKYNISIAEANTRAAKVMPDPELSLGYENSQDWSVQMGQSYSAELGYTLELGGKRRARIAVARSEQQMTEALVEDFFRNLRADATLSYLEALMQKQLVKLAQSSYESMHDLARGDSLRHAVGEIAEVDAMQSQLEATSMMSDYLQAEAEYKNRLSDLVVFEGGMGAIDSIVDPVETGRAPSPLTLRFPFMETGHAPSLQGIKKTFLHKGEHY